MSLDAPKSSPDTVSLLNRLAGASTGKAGLAKDQSEVNRIIAEASKGSKFYENEKRKDKELTIKIEKILQQRDDALNGVDVAKIEAGVDHILEEIESQRDLSQTIVHVDMDAFFANVEILHDPSLKDKPFAVGFGVLSTASYEARQFGVRSGMASFIAKKLCPHLILVPIHHNRYSEMSEKVMSVFAEYDPNMMAASCDEGYLNLSITTYCEEHHVTSSECVAEMRRRVFETTQLTVSAGIAPNKVLAKICSDKNKPNGEYYLPFDRQTIVDFMKNLSIRKVPGIGRVNERLLDSIGIKTCGDIYTHRAVLSLMDKHFGLRYLLQIHLGIASNVVEAHQREERKSIGAERTFNSLSDSTKILKKLEEVAEELEKDMVDNQWVGRTITLKYKLDTYEVHTKAKSFDRWIQKKEDLFSTGKELLSSHLPLTLRLIGLRVTKLKDLKESENNTIGIKRFLEPVHNFSNGKKRKFSNNKHAEQGEDILVDVDDDTEVQALSKTRPRPPVSAPARSQSDNTSATEMESFVSGSRKPRSADGRNTVTDKISPQQCPVCGKTLRTDNNGLNAHIDFCLSRDAIWEAQGEAPKKFTVGPPKEEKTGQQSRKKGKWKV